MPAASATHQPDTGYRRSPYPRPRPNTLGQREGIRFEPSAISEHSRLVDDRDSLRTAKGLQVLHTLLVGIQARCRDR